MGRQVVFTKEAEVTFNKLLDHLHEEFGDSAVQNFQNKFLFRLNAIASFPKIGIKEDLQPDVRSYSITSHTRLFYTWDDAKIVILAFMDMRKEN
jgi:plasmid stabilization system protein ParE